MRTGKVEPLSPEGAVSPQLHKRLRDLIVKGDMPPGQRISETEIASTYEVSRQPVREAFIKLSEESLVSIRPQRGTFVKRISISAALTARFIREAVEADIACRAVKRSTPEMVAAFMAQIDEQKEVAQSGSPSAFMRVDEAFHRMLSEFGGVPDVSDYLESLNVQMNRVRNISARQFSPDKLIRQHTAIVDAIASKDYEAADTAVRTHLREIQKDLPLIVESFPDYFEDTEALP